MSELHLPILVNVLRTKLVKITDTVSRISREGSQSLVVVMLILMMLLTSPHFLRRIPVVCSNLVEEPLV